VIFDESKKEVGPEASASGNKWESHEYIIPVTEDLEFLRDGRERFRGNALESLYPARSKAASVPTTFNPRWRAIITPSRSSISKRMA
jgi:hypothetical protein